MKKLAVMFLVALTLIGLVACVSAPQPGQIETILQPDVLEHKGTAFGANVPSWVMAYIEGGSAAVEKLAEYRGRYVVVLESSGQSRVGAQTMMDNFDITSQMARYMSTRVEQRFAGAQVGNRDEVEEYFENVVKMAAEATFTGLEPGPDWWVYLRYYKAGSTARNEANVERQEYRVLRIYSIDREILTEQLNRMLESVEDGEARTETEQRAIDAVQSAFYEGF